MVNYTVYNPTDAQFTDINGGGTDVPARSVLAGVTLTNTELATLLTAGTFSGAFATMDAQTAAAKGAAAAAILDDLISDLDLSSQKKVALLKNRASQEDMRLIANAVA